MKAYYEAELREAKAQGLSAAPAEIPVSSVAAFRRRRGRSRGGCRRGGREARRRASGTSTSARSPRPSPSPPTSPPTKPEPTRKPPPRVAAARGVARELLPAQRTRPAAVSLSQAWSEPPGGSRPENPPEVRYPHDADKPPRRSPRPSPPRSVLAEATGGGSPRALRGSRAGETLE